MAAIDEVPMTLAFGAGLVATVNPCGFAMLPSFIAYYLGSEASSSDGPAPASPMVSSSGSA